jgi:hypothetical protein
MAIKDIFRSIPMTWVKHEEKENEMNTKMVKAKRIGDLQKITNKNPHPAANSQYSHIRVQVEGGEEVHLLLTDAELARAVDRAEKNPEDCLKASWLRDILD